MEIVGSQRKLPRGGGKGLRIGDLGSVPCHRSPLAGFRTLSEGLSASEPQAHPPYSEDIRLAGLRTSRSTGEQPLAIGANATGCVLCVKALWGQPGHPAPAQASPTTLASSVGSALVRLFSGPPPKLLGAPTC